MARSISQLRETAIAALRHPMFRELIKLVPTEERNNPQLMLAWVEAAGSLDQRGAGRPEFIKANHALRDLVKAEAVERQYAEIYHDASLRQLAGDRWDELASDPAKAYAAAMELMSSNPKAYASPAVQRAIGFLAETKHAGYWSDTPSEPEAGDPDPKQPGTDAELAVAIDLGRTDAAAYRSPEHQERLAALANGQAPPPPASGAKARFDEMMSVMTTDWARYSSVAFQRELAGVAQAAQAEKAAAASAPASAAPATPSTPPPATTPPAAQGE